MSLSLENFRNECKDSNANEWYRYKDNLETWKALYLKQKDSWGNNYKPRISKVLKKHKCPNCDTTLSKIRILKPNFNPNNMTPDDRDTERWLFSCENCGYQYAREIFEGKLQH